MIRDRVLLRAVTVRIAVVVAAATISGCMGYVPGRQTYWDARIRDLCAKEGGFTVFERVRIARADVERGVLLRTWPSGQIGKGEPIIRFTRKALAHPDAPVYSVDEGDTVLRESNPSVIRLQSRVERRNGDVVARYVIYLRRGGDIPSHAHPSSFSCPDIQPMFQDLSKQLFIVE